MPAAADVLDSLDDGDTCLLVPHAQADIDALGSAVGLATVLDCDTRIVVPNGVGTRARRLERELDVDPSGPGEVDLPAADCVVVVDTSSSERVAPLSLEGFVGEVVVVDHHRPGDLLERATATNVDADAGATAALVARTVEASNSTVTPTAALALAAGLIDDTDSLTTATPTEFALLRELLAVAGGRVELLPALLRREPSFGERVATAKAVVRATGYRADDTLVLVTDVGGEQSAAARALRDAGADVALVVSDRGSQVWLVGRAGPDTVHLPADVFDPLVDRFGGQGGGHAEAGVAKFDTGTPSAIRAATLSRLETALGAGLSELS
jgi:phosphoesterase RecJ-like protein